MNLNQIEQAFGQILAAARSEPIEWPNRTLNNPPKPYLSVQHVPTIRQAEVGGGGTWRGFFTVTVVAERNEFTTEANTLAEAVASVVTVGQRIPCGGGVLTINKPPEPQAPYADGPDWRVPVRIDYNS